MRLRVSKAAEADLEEIFLYWAERVSVSVAGRVIDAIVDRFRLLGEFPKAGRAAEEIAKRVRCFPAGNYLIYYRTKRGFTDILHVFHGARDQKPAFRKPRK
jgi:toxin ParE1/3/4